MKRSIFYGICFLLALALPAQADDKRSDPQKKEPQKNVQNEPLFKDGKGYYSYKQALNVPIPEGKVLIQYFYQYDCAICLTADDYLKQYAERHKDKVVLQRSPAFVKKNEFSAKMNATFKAYGRPELSDKYLFDSASSKKEQSLVTNDEAIKRWLARNGVEIHQFHKLFSSPEVKAQVEKDWALYQRYSPPITPIAVLNGKYILIRNTLYNDDYTYAVLDFLVEKIQKEQQEQTEKGKQ